MGEGLGMAMSAFNPGTGEAETGTSLSMDG